MPRMQLQVKDKAGKIKNSGYMEIKNSADSADFTIFGDIVSDQWGKWTDDDTCPSDVKEFFDSLDANVSNINVYINSGGGSVFGGIAIYNLLKNHKASVTVHIPGIAASIASVIACAGDRVIIPKNGTFMIHKPSNGYFFTSMNADELRKDAETLDTCQKIILNTYMTKVKDGVTEDEINELINAETWFTGEDVVNYFDFEVEEASQTVACASDFFANYKHAPENLTKEPTPETNNGLDAESIANKVIEILDKRETEKQKENEAIRDQLMKDFEAFQTSFFNAKNKEGR